MTGTVRRLTFQLFCGSSARRPRSRRPVCHCYGRCSRRKRREDQVGCRYGRCYDRCLSAATSASLTVSWSRDGMGPATKDHSQPSFPARDSVLAAHVTMGQLVPCLGKGLRERVEIFRNFSQTLRNSGSVFSAMSLVIIISGFILPGYVRQGLGALGSVGVHCSERPDFSSAPTRT